MSGFSSPRTQYLEQVLLQASATSMTTGTAKTIVTITLTPGDWDVSATAYHVPAATTTVSRYCAALSLVNNTLDATATTAGRFSDFYQTAFASGGGTWNNAIPPYRFNVSVSTPIYLVGLATFATSTLASFGIIRARFMG